MSHHHLTCCGLLAVLLDQPINLHGENTPRSHEPSMAVLMFKGDLASHINHSCNMPSGIELLSSILCYGICMCLCLAFHFISPRCSHQAVLTCLPLGSSRTKHGAAS